MLQKKALDDYRDLINELDCKIISLIGERIDICRKIAMFKKKHNIPMMQQSRIEQVKLSCVKIGDKNKLNPTFILNLYDQIITEACRIEDELMSSKNDS